MAIVTPLDTIAVRKYRPFIDSGANGSNRPLPPYRVGFLNGREALESGPRPRGKWDWARREGTRQSSLASDTQPALRSPSFIQEKGIPVVEIVHTWQSPVAPAHRRAAFRNIGSRSRAT